jgi:hypothetical protein
MRPLFCVVLSQGERWTVEAEWQDGTIEPVNTFTRHLDAVSWVSSQSEAWLHERIGGAAWRRGKIGRTLHSHSNQN